ncbi:MAG TPA: hypothetical protein VGM54_20425 [Chthoniobacter sp.]|jgi:hypothetical protein
MSTSKTNKELDERLRDEATRIDDLEKVQGQLRSAFSPGVVELLQRLAGLPHIREAIDHATEQGKAKLDEQAQRLEELEEWRVSMKTDLPPELFGNLKRLAGVPEIKDLLDKETERAKNVSAQQDLKIQELEKSQKELNEGLPREVRPTLNKLAQWTAWLLVGLVALIPAGGFTVWQLFDKLDKSAQEKLQEAERVINERRDETVREAGKKIDTELAKDLVTKTNEAVENTIREQTKAQSRISSEQVVAAAKAFIEMQERSQDVVGRPPADNPLKLQDLMLSAEALEESYRSSISSGEITWPRRVALTYCLVGIMDDSQGFSERAADWWRLAAEEDTSMPEPLLLQARELMWRVRFIPKASNWTPAELVDKSIALMEQADRRAEEQLAKCQEMERFRIFLGTLRASREADLQKAVASFAETDKLANRQIVSERGAFAGVDERDDGDANRVVDPRVWFFKGYNLLLWYQRSGDEPLRVQSARAFLEAFRINPRHIVSLNNFLMLIAQNRNGELEPVSNILQKIAELDEKEPGYSPDRSGKIGITPEDYSKLAEGLGARPIIQNYGRLLDSLGQALGAVALGEGDANRRALLVEKALAMEKRACEAGRLYSDPDTKARLGKNYQDLEKRLKEKP